MSQFPHFFSPRRSEDPRDILVLGYSHNIQSSFGVTTEVIGAIRDWVAAQSDGALR